MTQLGSKTPFVLEKANRIDLFLITIGTCLNFECLNFWAVHSSGIKLFLWPNSAGAGLNRFKPHPQEVAQNSIIFIFFHLSETTINRIKSFTYSKKSVSCKFFPENFYSEIFYLRLDMISQNLYDQLIQEIIIIPQRIWRNLIFHLKFEWAAVIKNAKNPCSWRFNDFSVCII